MSNPGVTFKTRVKKFWDWYSDRAKFFYQAIEDGNCAELQPEVTEQLELLFPGFAWVFGPGENGGHSFTVTAAGDLNRQFLTSYWLSQAPVLEGWTFYSTRQPSALGDEMTIGINQLSFATQNLMIAPSIDEERQRIDIRVWDPTFEQTDDENLRYHVVFLWLDEALGETGTQNFIGGVELSPELGDNAMPVTKLKSYVDYIAAENEWKKLPPDQTYTMYQLPEPSDEFLRADTIAGTTCNMSLVGEYLESGGQMEDMLAGTGAEFWYLQIDPSILPKGKEVEVRGHIEDTLEVSLQDSFSGRVFGGALGMRGAYIDVVLFDGNESLRLIEEVMKTLELDDKYQLHPFATV